VTVRRIPPRLHRLGELARDDWWSRQPAARALLESVDPGLWRQTGHDPLRLLAEVPAERLEELAEDGGFVRRLAAVLEAFDTTEPATYRPPGAAAPRSAS
jgi:starch phosphorylase